MKTGWFVAVMFAAVTASAAGIAETKSPDVRAHFSTAKVRLVNVWATWCVPCVAEMDDLKRLDAAFNDAQLQLIGISLDDAIPGDRAKAKQRVDAFLKKKGVSFRNLYYTGTVPRLQDHYGFEGEIPLTVLYDRRGKERARYQGAIKLDVVKKDIQKLLKEKD